MNRETIRKKPAVPKENFLKNEISVIALTLKELVSNYIEVYTATN